MVTPAVLAFPERAVFRDTLSEGFRYFVTSGWSGCRVGVAPTGKRHLSTAHTLSGRFAPRSGLLPHAILCWFCEEHNDEGADCCDGGRQQEGLGHGVRESGLQRCRDRGRETRSAQ